MKRTITFLLFLFVNVVAFAQFFNTSHVPEAIRENLEKQFPHLRNLTWSKEQGGYQASFDTHRKHIYVLYSLDGAEVAQVTEVHKARLPRNVRKTLKKNYNTFQLLGATKIESPEANGYEAEIVKGAEAYELVFNERGWLVSVDPVVLSQDFSR